MESEVFSPYPARTPAPEIDVRAQPRNNILYIITNDTGRIHFYNNFVDWTLM